VTFIASDKLPRIRKRLNITRPLSEIRKEYSWFNSLFESPTIAFLWQEGDPEDTRNQCLKLVQQELDILSVSQLGLLKRRHNSYPRIRGSRTGIIVSTAHFDSKGHLAFFSSNQQRSEIIPLSIDGMWKDYHRNIGPFSNLLQIIQGKKEVQKSWRQVLRRVALLIGKSQCSKDLSHAFLLNMIVLEMLLSEGSDKYLVEMPKRVDAYLDWTLHSTGKFYSDFTEPLYNKRCDLVHRGKQTR
jgi:hypothetical protein